MWLTLALTVALIAAVWWGWQGHRNLRHERTYHVQHSAPPAEASPFPPLFCTLSDALDAGVIVLDSRRVIRYCNSTAATMFGVKPDEAHGRGIITLLRDYQSDMLIEHAIQTREAQQITLQPTLSNRIIQIWCEPLEQIERGVLLIARDRTQISLLERARRDLVANVSHELRTPLASLKLLVETLQTTPPPDVVRRMFSQMESELDAVMHLVDELHELSQIESGRLVLQLQRVSVAELVERAVARIHPQAERKQIQLQTRLSADLPPLFVDPDRISQVLLNLLHNAVKWTEPHGNISITAAVRERTSASGDSPQWVTLAVQDTGAGIPADAVPRIFERFYKVDRARTRNKGGTGLGLAIVKHLVEGHGGTVWVHSVEGAGSTFTLTLPVAE